MARLFGATLPNENNLIDPSAVNFGGLARTVVTNPVVQGAVPFAPVAAYGMNVAKTYEQDRVQDIGAAGGGLGNTFPFSQPQAPLAAQPTQAPAPQAEPIATPETRATPATDQGMNWAKAAQAAVKGFGVTPQGQGVQSMGDRGLVQDAQGRWVPGEALQQGVEANYQAGVAARNPAMQQAPMSQSELLDKELEKYNPTTGMGALFALSAAKANVASDYTAGQNALRAGEKQQELGLRDLATRLQGKELELKAEEAPALRELREAQTQQAKAESGYKKEQTRLYGTSLEQGAKAAEQKAAGEFRGKIYDSLTKLKVARANNVGDPKQLAYIDKQIAQAELELDALSKP